MFCKVCLNFMDITNNVSLASEQLGGEINGSSESEKKSDLNLSESSDYDVTISSKKKGGAKNDFEITEEVIQDILKGDIPDIEINEEDIIKINKVPYFNKLNDNQKTLIINRLYEKIPKNQKVPKAFNPETFKQSYFYCKNCGYFEKIPENMLILSRGNNQSSDETFNNFLKFYKYDSTLPISKNYNCINDSCPTHTNPIIKKAIFFRDGNSYVLKYICTVCDSIWSTENKNVSVI